jgi:hypothetical protein
MARAVLCLPLIGSWPHQTAKTCLGFQPIFVTVDKTMQILKIYFINV